MPAELGLPGAPRKSQPPEKQGGVGARALFVVLGGHLWDTSNTPCGNKPAGWGLWAARRGRKKNRRAACGGVVEQSRPGRSPRFPPPFLGRHVFFLHREPVFALVNACPLPLSGRHQFM